MYKIISNIKEEHSLREDIQFLYKIIDKEINNIISNISSKIYDYPTANQAKKYYNTEWFCNFISSVDAKIKLALLLKDLCKNYNVESLVWDSIINESSSILEQIDILQNKDKFIMNFEG